MIWDTELIGQILGDYTFRVVALGSLLLGIISGVLGSFAVLRKQSLLGDGISHAALPGVAVAFMITGSRNTETLLVGALCSGLIAVFFINKAVKNTRLKFDAALASVMSVMFGLGMVLLTFIQKWPNANQAGLKRFLYGQAGAMMERDAAVMAICGGIILILVVIFWKVFKVFSFDQEFSEQLGFSGRVTGLMLSLLTVTAIVIGLQTVGAVLMSAMLITPAVAARQWTDRLYVMVILSAAIGGVSGVVGTLFSSTCEGLPTGPAIVLTVTGIALFSLLFAVKRGIIYRLYIRRKAITPGKGERI